MRIASASRSAAPLGGVYATAGGTSPCSTPKRAVRTSRTAISSTSVARSARASFFYLRELRWSVGMKWAPELYNTCKGAGHRERGFVAKSHQTHENAGSF